MKLPKYLRCYAKKDLQYWDAVCIDLNLVATGDTLKQAKEKLHAQIADYIDNALTVDYKYVDQLIPRRAPFSFIVEYYWIKLLVNFYTKYKSTNDYLSRYTPYFELVKLKAAF